MKQLNSILARLTVLVILILLAALCSAKGPGTQEVRSSVSNKGNDAKEVAKISAKATVEAAGINARQTKENALIQAEAAKEIGLKQVYAQVALAFTAILAAVVTYRRLLVDDRNARAALEQAKEKMVADLEQSQVKLKTEREQFESRQLADSIALEKRLSDERERHITQSTAQDRKQISDRFVDVQDRLVSGKSGPEAVNAVYGLADVAKTLDPQFVYRPAGIDLAPRLGLPEVWVPSKLLVAGQPRPTEKAYPYFRGAVLRLASILHLEENQSVRDAAVRAIGQLSAHSHREIEGLEWTDFQAYESQSTALRLTSVLMDALVQANRDARSQWVISWAQFIAAADACGEASEFTEEVDGDQDILPYPREPEKRPGEDEAAFRERSRKDRKIRLLGEIWFNQDTDGQPPYSWEPHDGLWNTSLMLCPFLSDVGLLTDLLLDAQKESPFVKAYRSHLQAVRGMSDIEKERERIEMRKRLDVNAQRLISSRDAIASAVRAGSFKAAQMPPAFNDRNATVLTDEAATVLRQSIWNQHGDELMVRTQLELRLGHNIAGTYLPGIDFSRCSNPGIRLAGSRLDESSFDHAWLPGSQFTGASLLGAEFTSANLRGADFGSARIDYSTFHSADLSGTALDRASLCEALLRSAHYPGSTFIGAKLRDAQVDSASLCWLEDSGTDLTAECDIYNSDGTLVPRQGRQVKRSRRYREDN